MIVLGITTEHNSSAALSIDGVLVGLVQEERFTKKKNQVAFPRNAIRSLLDRHLDGDARKIDSVAFAGLAQDPFGVLINRWSQWSVHDHIREMHTFWKPHLYEGKPLDPGFWLAEYERGKARNLDCGYDDLSFLWTMPAKEAVAHHNRVVRPGTVRELGIEAPIQFFDHHTCHAYYAYHGAQLPAALPAEDILVFTADGAGDGLNWSVSVPSADGRLERLAAGADNLVGRLYRFTTLILGMKPNEHEYKVMGLAPYTTASKYVADVEDLYSEILDFRDGRFVSEKPLIDSYFDLRNRLEGHRFDAIARGLQNWATRVTINWMRHWMDETGRRSLCFSGGLAMNIKSNGEIAAMAGLNSLSIPGSGGDESLSAGAVFMENALKERPPTPLHHLYLGMEPGDDWTARLGETPLGADDFSVLEGVDAQAVAALLAGDEILARCVGPMEFGARALGNRSILANPSNLDNVKKINDTIKNRDYWMPFTPSVLDGHLDALLDGRTDLASPFMMVGLPASAAGRRLIPAALHQGDLTARPQRVSQATNPEYWAILEAFRQRTGVPALLNTSLNLHGEPMNATLADAARTVALSQLDVLLMPEGRLLVKNRALERIMARLGG
ncbi:carbamoyltransferase C-terminal domain-containing protein [Roseospirillum parvum]|uniref:Carbamoyltransferase n=1 Tax=Roseospirillum parvum TaxID=83401 RepID=A0A1G7UZL2_9PROT|nr:carbamoyltransferase C-terminal domain-containing protein [Roseospirillum parvum]SDG52973.1 carbamoyltransferase [Roseospirillum parvum]